MRAVESVSDMDEGMLDTVVSVFERECRGAIPDGVLSICSSDGAEIARPGGGAINGAVSIADQGCAGSAGDSFRADAGVSFNDRLSVLLVPILAGLVSSQSIWDSSRIDAAAIPQRDTSYLGAATRRARPNQVIDARIEIQNKPATKKQA